MKNQLNYYSEKFISMIMISYACKIPHVKRVVTIHCCNPLFAFDAFNGQISQE